MKRYWAYDADGHLVAMVFDRQEAEGYAAKFGGYVEVEEIADDEAVIERDAELMGEDFPGYDETSWGEHYVGRDRPEFPTYYDAQGREHGEY